MQVGYHNIGLDAVKILCYYMDTLGYPYSGIAAGHKAANALWCARVFCL